MDKMKFPLTKAEIDQLVDQYHTQDGHDFPNWMSYTTSDNEVRYDYDSSKIGYSLVRLFQPTNCLEFGVSFGHSLLFNADALEKNGKPYSLIGFEKLIDVSQTAQRNIDRVHPNNKNIIIYNEDIMGALDKIPNNLDYVFIDTDHEELSTEWYIKNIFPKCRPGALIAIHDMPLFTDENGDWKTKGDLGEGGTYPETRILLKLEEEGKLPLKKIFWTYEYRDQYEKPWEATFWILK